MHPQRRSGPRRRVIATVRYECSQVDRRRSKLGIDGLLRMVLADIWQDNPHAIGLRLIE
jgi:hypothetical protein